MAETHELAHRVGVLETHFQHVVSAVEKLTNSVDAFAKRPQQIAWREIAVTAGAFLALFAYVGNYLENQYAKNIAVEKYRIEQTERKLCVINAVFCTK